MIGSLKINISDVVRNDRLRDTFALQETQKGDIQLTLDWHPIQVGDMSTLEQTGDQKEVERFKKQQEDDKKRYCQSQSREASATSALPARNLLTRCDRLRSLAFPPLEVKFEGKAVSQ